MTSPAAAPWTSNTSRGDPAAEVSSTGLVEQDWDRRVGRTCLQIETNLCYVRITAENVLSFTRTHPCSCFGFGACWCSCTSFASPGSFGTRLASRACSVLWSAQSSRGPARRGSSRFGSWPARSGPVPPWTLSASASSSSSTELHQIRHFLRAVKTKTIVKSFVATHYMNVIFRHHPNAWW